MCASCVIFGTDVVYRANSEIQNKLEQETADKFHQGGGKLSILKL